MARSNQFILASGIALGVFGTLATVGVSSSHAQTSGRTWTPAGSQPVGQTAAMVFLVSNDGRLKTCRAVNGTQDLICTPSIAVGN